MHEVLDQSPPEVIPSVKFVRQCCVTVQVFDKTIATIKLPEKPKWDQLHADATTHG